MYSCPYVLPYIHSIWKLIGRYAEGVRVSQSIFVLFLQLVSIIEFAIVMPAATAISVLTPPRVSTLSGIDSRRTSMIGAGGSPRNLNIRNQVALADVLSPQVESIPFSVQLETAKPNAFPNPFGQDTLLSHQTAPDPKYNAYEMAENLYSTIDSIKSVVGMLLDVGELEVELWKFEDGEPSQDYVPDLSDLDPRKCYVIREIRSNNGYEFFRTFYWIGEHALVTNAAAAASFAVQRDAEVNSSVNVHREAQGRESHAFKELFKRVQFKATNTQVDLGEFYEVYENRMFLISRTKDDKLNFKEASSLLGLHYAYNIRNNCLVFISKKVYVCCGMDTTEPQRLAADELAERILEITGLSETVTIHRDKPVPELSKEQKDHLLKLFAALSSIPKTTVQNQLLQIYRISEDQHGAFQMEEESAPLPLKSVLNPQNCFLLDSCSAAGIFVWMDKGSSVDVRMESARRVELFLKQKNYGNTTPVTYINHDDVSAAAWSFQGVLPSLLVPQDGKDSVFVTLQHSSDR